MVDFALEERFDAIVCLFSSIGYIRKEARLRAAVQNMAHHLKPGGVLVIEPWLTPDVFQHGTVYATYVDQPELKIARMNISQVQGDLSVFDFHYLVALRLLSTSPSDMNLDSTPMSNTVSPSKRRGYLSFMIPMA